LGWFLHGGWQDAFHCHLEVTKHGCDCFVLDSSVHADVLFLFEVFLLVHNTNFGAAAFRSINTVNFATLVTFSIGSTTSGEDAKGLHGSISHLELSKSSGFCWWLWFFNWFGWSWSDVHVHSIVLDRGHDVSPVTEISQSWTFFIFDWITIFIKGIVFLDVFLMLMVAFQMLFRNWENSVNYLEVYNSCARWCSQ
jgi:hypothetical protein